MKVDPSSIAFSTFGYGLPTGDVKSATVGDGYTQQIFLGSDPNQKYNITLAPGWNLPPGLQLERANGTPASNDVVDNASSFLVAGDSTASGQYNVAFLAKNASNPEISDTVVYHFVVNPAPSSFQGTVISNDESQSKVAGSNQLVLPPGSLNQPYNAKILLSHGNVKSVELKTQINDGQLVSAINSQTPVPGLIAGSNVQGVDQNSGALQSDKTANVAGLAITWSKKTNSIDISGTPTVSFGGLNDPLILQVTDTNNQTLYYNFAMTYSPSQIASAYGLDKVIFNGGIHGNGAGQTIAILSSGDSSAFVSSSNPNFGNSDLAQFDKKYGINNFDQPGGPVFLKLDQNGGTNYPAQTPVSDDPTEAPQDIEWVHALAPMANIVVIESPDSDSAAALNLVQNWNVQGVPSPTVMTSSFGALSLNGGPYASGVTYLASSGDFGSSGGTNNSLAPANVIEVGYSQVQINNSGAHLSEQGVNGGTMQTTAKIFQSGGGVDTSQSQPFFQQYVPNNSNNPNPVSSAGRIAPDVGFNGAETSGVGVYDSFINTTTVNFKTNNGNNYAFGGSPWGNAWGTSIATPSWAAVIGIANQGRAISGQNSLDGLTQTLPTLYSLANTGAFNLIGNTVNQTSQQITAVLPSNGNNYYNEFTGLGSPQSNVLIPALASQLTPVVGTPLKDTLIGSGKPTQFIGLGGGDTLTGSVGVANEFYYTSLNDTGSTITNFQAGIDQINLTQLLNSIGYKGKDPILDHVVGFKHIASGTFVTIDNDGLGIKDTAHNFAFVKGLTETQLNNPNNFVF